MKLSWTAVLAIALAPICGGIALTPLPNLAQNSLTSQWQPAASAQSGKTSPLIRVPFKGEKFDSSAQKVGTIPPKLAQQTSPTPSVAGEEILQEVVECVKTTVPSGQMPSLEQIQAASSQCVFKVVMLAPDGSIRPDANERMIALVKTTGITLPKPSSQGQASVTLKPVAEQQLFSLSVSVGGQPKTFLLDTGASNSIVDSQIAQQLGLPATPIPQEMLAYMVVGDNCSDINASLHEMPVMAVDKASVQGITGMGLPKTAIPGDVSGVLGLDFLSGFDMVVNPKSFQLQLLPPSGATADVIPLKGKMGVMTAQVEINGQGPFTFLLDTGADLSVVSDRLAGKLSLDLANAKDIEVQGFCGTEAGKQTTLPQFSLREHQVSNLDAVILKSDVLDLLGVEGIIGQNFLSRYQQHWRFGERNELGFPNEGSLVLTPL
ncbi:MAG: retroviral-like aspartic protease family protein [Microcoleus vaginatus WJT46-NPBG5]|jgi:predicted aspartyl protease|nr:retroviral-like aspartic protease family protein [Microcoleus vaginatus WJT46-NPBG5]